MIPLLPEDIHILIIRSYIASLPITGNQRQQSLRISCLVSRLYLIQSRQALFKQFTVDDSGPDKQTRLFWPRLLFFILHPHISQHVYTLEFHGKAVASTLDSIAVLPAVFPNVKMIEVFRCEEDWVRARVLRELAPRLRSLHTLSGLLTTGRDTTPLIGRTQLDGVKLQRLQLSSGSSSAMEHTLADFSTSGTRQTLHKLIVNLSYISNPESLRSCLDSIPCFSMLWYLSLAILPPPIILDVLTGGPDMSLGALPNVTILRISTCGVPTGVTLLRNLLVTATLPSLVNLGIRIYMLKDRGGDWRFRPFSVSNHTGETEQDVIAAHTSRQLKHFSVTFNPSYGRVLVHDAPRFLSLFGEAGRADVMKVDATSQAELVLQD